MASANFRTASMSALSESNVVQLVKDGQFLRVWLVGVCRGVSQWLEMLVAGIFAFELTGSPFLVALLFMVRLMPLTILGSIVGTIADRVSPRGLLLAGFSFATLVSASVFAALTLAEPAYWVVLVASVASGIVWTSDMPVRRRILGEVAGPDRIVAAMGLDSATNHATRMLGPLVGGFIYQFLGPAGAYGLTAVLYLAAFVLVKSLADTVPAGGGQRNGARLIEQLREGFSFSFRNRDVLVFLLVTIVFNVWGFPFLTMIPVIGADELHLSAGLIGILASLEGAGAFLGCLAVATSLIRFDPRRFYYFGVFFYLVFAFVVGMMPSAVPAGAMLFCAGLSLSGFSSMQSALVFLIAPPEMRSRLFGVIVICIGSGLLGVANIGLMGEWLGGSGAVRVVAAEGLVIVTILGLAWRELRRRPDGMVQG